MMFSVFSDRKRWQLPIVFAIALALVLGLSLLYTHSLDTDSPSFSDNHLPQPATNVYNSDTAAAVVQESLGQKNESLVSIEEATDYNSTSNTQIDDDKLSNKEWSRREHYNASDYGTQNRERESSPIDLMDTDPGTEQIDVDSETSEPPLNAVQPPDESTPVISESWQQESDELSNQIAPMTWPNNDCTINQLDEELFSAKQTIADAPFTLATESGLHAAVYHNASMFIKSYELMEKTFRIYIYKDGSRPLSHVGPTVGIYASEGRFINLLHFNKHFVVKDPSKAHMFFLPYSVANLVNHLYVPDSHTMAPITHYVTSYVKSIASRHPYWNRSHGADHFFVSCHDWGPATARGHAELRYNSMKVVCNADITEEFVVEKDISLPETFLHSAKLRKLGGPPPQRRPYLAFFAGQMHGRVRPVLLQYWKDKDPDMKIYEKLPPAIAKKTSYIRHMKLSKYCLCPMGYEVNSPRIVEAIYYDCVPVIIADHFVLPFSDVLKWSAFSVTVEEKDVPSLKQILASIPSTQYQSMQANLRHVRQHFLWHYRSAVKYDIFHMILHSIWLRRLNTSTSCHSLPNV